MRRLRAAAIAAAALTAPSASAAAAGPVGLIREFPIHAGVSSIIAGPEGNIWFTANGRHNTIGKVSPSGKVTQFRRGLGARVEPLDIVTGPDGNLWFTYTGSFTGFSGGGVGRIMPTGKVTLFSEAPGSEGSPFDIVTGPDGNLWFNHAAILTPSGQTIGRITPQGEITEFGSGLQPGAAVVNLTAGPDGNVWFGDNSNHPAVGRITPSGEITEFPGLAPEEYPLLYGPTPAGDGNLYFSANEKQGIAVERISPGGAIKRYRGGLGPRAWLVGPFGAGRGGDVWFRVERTVKHGEPGWPNGRSAIARLTPSGRITEFSRCLRPLPGFAGPEDLTLGSEGNIWFTTRESGSPGHAKRSSTPSIGRVTPSGRITEFRYGLHPESEPEELTLASGRLWFLDRRNDSIGVIAPPRRPANTFQVLRLKHKHFPSRYGVEVAVPGPGTLRLQELGGRPWLASSTAAAPACGPAVVGVPLRPRQRRLLHRRGVLFFQVRITFKPRGGAPFSEPATVELGGGEG
jgi:streptogramin lyase